MKTAAQLHWENRGVVTVRPDAPRDTTIVSRPGLYLEQPGEALLTARMLLEMRRKIQKEADDLRAYAEDCFDEETRRVCVATADRLEEIIGGAPV